jgi:hypothetical protein
MRINIHFVNVGCGKSIKNITDKLVLTESFMRKCSTV